MDWHPPSHILPPGQSRAAETHAFPPLTNTPVSISLSALKPKRNLTYHLSNISKSFLIQLQARLLRIMSEQLAQRLGHLHIPAQTPSIPAFASSARFACGLWDVGGLFCEGLGGCGGHRWMDVMWWWQIWKA
jgi:hypothetical protein